MSDYKECVGSFLKFPMLASCSPMDGLAQGRDTQQKQTLQDFPNISLDFLWFVFQSLEVVMVQSCHKWLL